jgi:hypothetical protein
VWLREVAPADSAGVVLGFFNSITVVLVWPDTFDNLKD